MYKLLALWLLLLSVGAVAGEKGYIGLAVTVDAQGFFSPTLRSITVSQVLAGSPAERAGISAGDQLLEIEGHTVSGANANDFKPYLQIDAGQPLHLAVKKSSGEVKSIFLVAGNKP